MAEPIPATSLLLIDESRQEEISVTHTPFTIGRLQDRDLVLAHAFISRDHAAILYEKGQFHIVDKGSRHGTFLNAKPLVDRQQLKPGDEIRLGSVNGPSLRFGPAKENTSTIHKLLDELHAISTPTSDLEKLSWFLSAAQRLNTTGAVNEILATLVEATLELTQVERGYVFLRNEKGTLTLAAGRSLKGDRLEDDSTISHSAIAQACKANKFIVTDTLSAEANPRTESMVQQSIRMVYCIPLRKRTTGTEFHEKDILGVLYMDSRLQPGKLSQVDNDLLETISTEAAALVENAFLAQAEESARRVREELNIAAAIQQGLMEFAIPNLPYAKVAARSVACKEVGGDFYDVIATPDGLYVVIADISGKGVSAAILASTLQGLLYGLLLAGQPLAQIADVANRYICEKNVQKYATMILVRLGPDGMFEYVNCGHVQPILVNGASIRRLENANMVVGLIEEATFNSERLQLNPGDRIVLATDGVTEAESTTGEFFGDDRLQAAVAGSNIEGVLRQVETFMNGAPPNDDFTMLEVAYGA
ncbi:MAG TPA: SpoIIE family protein phosphatase [Acidobacteriaceae bacterium]|nr:SpoIIE family protein phosphatase [Acidobacteriaceae bacterium]